MTQTSTQHTIALPPSERGWISASELADLRGEHVSSVTRRLKPKRLGEKPEIRASKVGREWRIPLSEVARLADNCEAAEWDARTAAGAADLLERRSMALYRQTIAEVISTARELIAVADDAGLGGRARRTRQNAALHAHLLATTELQRAAQLATHIPALRREAAELRQAADGARADRGADLGIRYEDAAYNAERVRQRRGAE